MKPRFVGVALLVVVAGVASAVLFHWLRGGVAIPHGAHDPRAARVLVTEAAATIVDPDVMTRLASRHDSDVARFGSEEELRVIIAQTLEAEAPDDQELEAWYQAHGRLFGTRSFEASKAAVRQLVRIEMTREALGVQAIELHPAAVAD